VSRSALILAAAQSQSEAFAGLLQRKCDCGNRASNIDGECEECQQKNALGLQTKLAIGASNDPLEHEADHAAARVVNMAAPGVLGQSSAPMVQRRATRAADGVVGPVPKAVNETLQTPGAPLSAQARAFFEPRFGYDFAAVRIHDDTRGAESARAVGAHAYTVGNHVVFNRGRYRPQSATGKLLLAHELAHVIQQDRLLRREAISPEPRGHGSNDDLDELLPATEPANEVGKDEASTGGIGGLLQRQVDDEIAAPGDLPGGGWAEKDAAAEIRAQAQAERECIAATAPDPIECDPAGSLSWSDFSGPAPRRARFGAMTFSVLRERSMNTALLRCMPNTAVAQANPPARGVQAFFDGARSGVRARYANAADQTVNGCQNTIGECESYFDRQARRGLVGGEWWMTPGAGCAASVTPRGDHATSRAECATVVASDCNERAQAESVRLLNHEQVHFNLTCAMARKANTMLSSSADFAALLGAAQRTLAQQQRLYDNQSDHGCVAAQQASWETAIAAGLPGVTIRVPSRRRGRGGRGGRRR
jgi:hypothetical protein